jgi:hypothetical protein
VLFGEVRQQREELVFRATEREAVDQVDDLQRRPRTRSSAEKSPFPNSMDVEMPARMEV